MNDQEPEIKGKHTVFLFTDIVGSVKLQSRLGTEAYTSLLVRHTAIFKEALADIGGAEITQDTGDGFLVQLQTATDGVRAALKLQYLLTHSDWPNERPEVRIGLHQGQITLIESDTDKGGKIVGMTINIAARTMDLAEGRQILLTRAVFDDARQYVREHPEMGGDEPLPLEWKAHGRYSFKGAEEPMEVFEVGAVGLAPLSPPADSEKAKRAISPEEEATLGWRPGVGLEIPHRPGWVLEKELGVGGFGEVWLAVHQKLQDQRVFKFCFDADRLRSFKREVTLFRLIRKALGNRPDITAIHEINFESPPFFLELDYVEGGDLKAWSDAKGGIANIPLEERLSIIAQLAETLAAAHSLGIIHKDIKPSNVLIKTNDDGSIRPQLMDFGIGFLGDASKLEEFGITGAGFTETIAHPNDSSRTGTRMYAPPEILAGKPHTMQGDIYAVGVFLYQMSIGDLSKPLAMGWQREIENEILLEDISACVDGDMDRRLSSAVELTKRLQGFGRRSKELEQQPGESKRTAKERRFRVRLALATSAGLLAVSMLLSIGLFGKQIKNAFTNATGAMGGKGKVQQDDMGSFTDDARSSTNDVSSGTNGRSRIRQDDMGSFTPQSTEPKE